MIQPIFNSMLTLMIAKFILNDLPHAASLLKEKHYPMVYDPTVQLGAVRIDPETFTPIEIRIQPGLSKEEEKRVLAHEKLEWEEAVAAKARGMTFKEYVERRIKGEKGLAHEVIPVVKSNLGRYPPRKGVIPKLPEEARGDFIFFEYVRDMCRYEALSEEDVQRMWESFHG